MLFCFLAKMASAAERTEYESTAQEFSQAVEKFRSVANPAPHEPAGAFGRDPMQPLLDAQDNIVSSETHTEEELIVQGIVESGGSRTALINGKLCTQGASINGSQILEIRSDGVVIQKADKTVFIPLYSSSSHTS